MDSKDQNVNNMNGGNKGHLVDVACIVVHYRRFPQVLDAVSSLLTAGVDPSVLVVVDNSEDQDISMELGKALPRGSSLLLQQNRGYAAAVNAGFEHLKSENKVKPFTLVATHDVSLFPDCVEKLRDVMCQDQRIAVSGPLLLTCRKDGSLIWSMGGGLRTITKIPYTIEICQKDFPPEIASLEDACDVMWLDGAINLYRSDILDEHPLCEQFFLYYEETDEHVLLHSLGNRVVVALSAKGQQSSQICPAFLHGRNLCFFLKKHNWSNRIPLALIRMIVSYVTKIFRGRRTWRDFMLFLKGVEAGLFLKIDL